MRKKSWDKTALINAVRDSRSIRQVIKNLGLKPAGGNYSQISKYLLFYKVNTSHFKGKGWSKGNKMPFKPKTLLSEILVLNSQFQSYKLKNRLLKEGLKTNECEICGWAKKSIDGRVPLELDHINGNHSDNRIENLRIICPNCHSLQPTHRGKNSK